MENVTVNDVLERLGGANEAARKLGVARTTVLGWRKDRRVPAGRLLAIHDQTGIEISRLRGLVAVPATRT